MFSAPSSQREPGIVARPFRHVLVGWDGSPDSVTALKTAIAIVGNEPGRVTALAVLPESRQLEDGQDVLASAGQTWEAFHLARTASGARSPARISLHTTHGRQVAKLICDYAAEHGFDLLVLGRHGDGGLLRPKLGRIAEAAARRSSIPVLLVSAS